MIRTSFVSEFGGRNSTVEADMDLQQARLCLRVLAWGFPDKDASSDRFVRRAAIACLLLSWRRFMTMHQIFLQSARCGHFSV